MPLELGCWTGIFDERLLLLTALVTVAYQLCWFLVAFSFKFDKVTDLAGGSNFVLLALLTFAKGDCDGNTMSVRRVTMTALVVLWGVRLSGFLLMRVLAWGHDRRFDETRERCGPFALFWTYQAVWVWTVSLPLTLVNTATQQPPQPLQALDFVGWAMFVLGLVLEACADHQKLRFKQDKQRSLNRWCDVGLWSVSRHPNYFGEITLWWGMYIAALPALRSERATWLLGLASPLFTCSVLLFLTGIPLLEKSADKRYAHLAEYAEYKRRTSLLVPLPACLYAAIPYGAKRVLCCEGAAHSDSAASTVANADAASKEPLLGGNNGTSPVPRDQDVC